jgi:hypothetical protein
MSINDSIQKAEKEYGLGKGEYFKCQEGANKIRVMSELIFHAGDFKGNPTYRMVCWVLDYVDNIIKPYFMPLTVARALGALEENPEYAFNGYPMPYDVTVYAKGAGTKEVEYQVTAARSNTPLTPTAEVAMAERMPITEFVAKLNEKQSTTPSGVVATAQQDGDLPPVENYIQ